MYNLEAWRENILEVTFYPPTFNLPAPCVKRMPFRRTQKNFTVH
ncbi:hypothetical protein DSUL_60018 [Desulfovibrionales bacterium]